MTLVLIKRYVNGAPTPGLQSFSSTFARWNLCPDAAMRLRLGYERRGWSPDEARGLKVSMKFANSGTDRR